MKFSRQGEREEREERKITKEGKIRVAVVVRQPPLFEVGPRQSAYMS